MKSSTFGAGLSPLVFRSFDTCLLIIYTFISFFCLIHQIPSKCLFSLLASLDRPSPDSLEVLDLVRAEKPLKPMVRKLSVMNICFRCCCCYCFCRVQSLVQHCRFLQQVDTCSRVSLAFFGCPLQMTDKSIRSSKVGSLKKCR